VNHAKKAANKPKADRANTKSRSDRDDEARQERHVAEIMKATGWQAHTIRGFGSILGSKGGEKIESSKNAAGEWTYKVGK
jgi:hypothetical protein